MITLFIFYVSGAVVAILLLAKIWESKRRKSFMFLNLISKGDEGFRNFSHDATHAYSVFKEKGDFFIRKQLPLHTRNTINKTEILIKEKAEKYLGNMRNSKLLHPRSEGISEFFKNISEMEKQSAEALENSDLNEEIVGGLDQEKKKI